VRKLDSPRYTILFATAVCVICALLVSVAAVSLQPRQAANARFYMEKNVLVAAGLVKAGEAITADQLNEMFERRIRARLVEFSSGDLVPAENVNARAYDQRRARNDPGASRVAPPNNAGIGRMPNYGIVYFVMDGDKVEQVIIAVEGLGMWGTIFGFLSLAPDANTVRGLTFYEQKETPGLGGEIGSPPWLSLWEGRRGYDERGQPRITVIKGPAGPPETDPLRVDGLSGATITGNAVTRLMQFWLSEDGYGRFLTRFREGAMT
jgi:Na+-transporting NADH:ubiquinone oxidoreductase subunit C